MLLRRIGQGTSKRRSENTSNRPHKRHDTKCTGLELFLRNHLCHHCPDDTHVSIHQTLERARDNQRGEGTGEAEHEGEDHREGQAE